MSKEAKQPFDLIDRAAVSRFTGDPLIGTLPMEGSVSGHHRSNHKGSSVEFAEYREYTPTTKNIKETILAVKAFQNQDLDLL